MPLFLVNCPEEEPTAYHPFIEIGGNGKGQQRPQAIPWFSEHVSSRLNVYVSNTRNSIRPPKHRNYLKFLLAKKQSIRVKVKVKFARVDHWGCCHQKDLQFIVICFQHGAAETSNLNPQRGTPSCQIIVTLPKIQPSQ